MRLLAALLCLIAAPAFAGDVQLMMVGSVERAYSVYRPADLGKEQQAPLVVMLHGGFGNGAQAEKSYGWDAAASKGGFVVAFPDGLHRAWNAGGDCCGRPVKDNTDDLGFLTQLIKQLVLDENIDPKRVYIAGMSNGAAMAYRYACEGEYPVAAIAAVAGSFSGECANPRRVSVLEIHGLQDKHVPFDGGPGNRGVSHADWLGVPKTLAVFEKADGCDAPVKSRKGKVETSVSGCADGKTVELVTIDDAGHQWPGGSHKGLGQLIFGGDQPSEALNATDTVWAFFAGSH